MGDDHRIATADGVPRKPDTPEWAAARAEGRFCSRCSKHDDSGVRGR